MLHYTTNVLILFCFFLCILQGTGVGLIYAIGFCYFRIILGNETFYVKQLQDSTPLPHKKKAKKEEL
jgi:hypothetical protein